MSANQSDVLFRSFSPAYYFSKIFGAMPFKINKTYVRNSKNRQWCRIGLIFSFINVALVFLSMLLTKELNNLTKFKGKKMLTIHDKTQRITAPMFVWSVRISQIFIAISFILLPVQLGELNQLFQHLRRLLNSADGRLLFGGDERRAEKMVSTVRRNTWKMIVVYAFLAISSAISSFNRIRLSPSLTFVTMMDVVTKKMVALSLCIEFCSICDILLQCYRSINENLIALKLRHRKKHADYPFLDEITIPTEHILKSLSANHAQLCDILQQLNKIYQLQNLLGIIICTLQMLPHLFLTGIILTYSNFTIIHSSFFLWPAQYLYRVFIVCNSATQLTSQATKTCIHLSRLYEEQQSTDENSKQEIVLFMERINSRFIGFSLCGLSKLDNECFLSNLVTVSGYFIIILQSYMTQIENWPTEIHSEWAT